MPKFHEADEKSEGFHFTSKDIEGLSIMQTFIPPDEIAISQNAPWNCQLLKDINRAVTICDIPFKNILDEETNSGDLLTVIDEKLKANKIHVDRELLYRVSMAYSQAPSGFMQFLYHHQFSDDNRSFILSKGTEIAIKIDFEDNRALLIASASQMTLACAEDPEKIHTITGHYKMIFEATPLDEKGKNGFQLVSIHTDNPVFAGFCQGEAVELALWNKQRPAFAEEMNTLAGKLESRKSTKAQGIRILAELLKNNPSELLTPDNVLKTWLTEWSRVAKKSPEELFNSLNRQEKPMGRLYGAFFSTQTDTDVAVKKIFPEVLIEEFFELSSSAYDTHTL